MPRALKVAGGVLLVALIGIQLIRPDRINPAEDAAMTVSAHLSVPPGVQSILERSCFDCHSSRTRWPWYSAVAPLSWMIADDVQEGRSHLNFSQWGAYKEKRIRALLDMICIEIDKGEMPLRQYVLLHPAAALTEEEKDLVCSWAEMASDSLTALSQQP